MSQFLLMYNTKAIEFTFPMVFWVIAIYICIYDMCVCVCVCVCVLLSERDGLKLNIKKLRSWHPVP